MRLIHLIVYLLCVLSALCVYLGMHYDIRYHLVNIVILPLAVLGLWDLVQTRHSVMRNYPIVAHLRWLFEGIRPEFRQYFFESDISGSPFNRDQRSLVYERAKNTIDKQPFGTELDVYQNNYAWLNHSVAPEPVSKVPYRVTVGGHLCSQPYSASVYNISAMSFGALSANAILALNKGAKMGHFAHDTGEGGISRYHRTHGGDLIWELGTGYFGCRHEDGSFDQEMFATQATDDQVKMVEIKISQGAKPGHGGVLPGAKVSREIADARKVKAGVDCNSPSFHSAFSTPIGLMEFIARLRELSGGKPVGFKLCLGHRWEFMAICKAMMETDIVPDFIVVDGAEGGTGAAPIEFSDHLGCPLHTGLNFVRNVLVGCNLRENIRIAASGKIISSFDIVRAMALGADWCNSARGFMFAVGCIQSQKCHTNRCPVGVTTQNKLRQRALVVEDKSQRVYRFHRNTVEALTELVAAAGYTHPSELNLSDFCIREAASEILTAREMLVYLEPGELLDGCRDAQYAENWAMASASGFRRNVV